MDADEDASAMESPNICGEKKSAYCLSRPDAGANGDGSRAERPDSISASAKSTALVALYKGTSSPSGSERGDDGVVPDSELSDPDALPVHREDAPWNTLADASEMPRVLRFSVVMGEVRLLRLPACRHAPLMRWLYLSDAMSCRRYHRDARAADLFFAASPVRPGSDVRAMLAHECPCCSTALSSSSSCGGS